MSELQPSMIAQLNLLSHLVHSSPIMTGLTLVVATALFLAASCLPVAIGESSINQAIQEEVSTCRAFPTDKFQHIPLNALSEKSVTTDFRPS